MYIRKAKLDDVKQILVIRHAVNENKLSNPNSITEKDVKDFLYTKGEGWVCEISDKIVGFCMVDLNEGNVWALFVLPEVEGHGIGSKLHEVMVNWYFDHKRDNLWLGTSPDTGAEKFYRKCGWVAVGKHLEDEIKFEMTYELWNSLNQIR